MCHSGDVWRELRRTLPLISGVVPVPEVWALSEGLEEEGVEVRSLEALSDGRDWWMPYHSLGARRRRDRLSRYSAQGTPR
jgi:hypothetical protein